MISRLHPASQLRAGTTMASAPTILFLNECLPEILDRYIALLERRYGLADVARGGVNLVPLYIDSPKQLMEMVQSVGGTVAVCCHQGQRDLLKGVIQAHPDIDYYLWNAAASGKVKLRGIHGAVVPRRIGLKSG